ncbi:MAG: hypothetical protein AAF618_00020 [Pseudomonadota bacterium]
MPKGDPKRPWQGAETRLGVKMFGRGPKGSHPNEAGIGFALTRLRPPILAEGEETISASPELVSAELTAAEYKTVREDCGLSVAEAAVFHDVRERIIERWQDAGPPSGAARELLTLRAKIEEAARSALKLYDKALRENPTIDAVDLYRYREWSYEESVPASEGLPHGAHNRIIAKTASLLAEQGIPVRIEYWAPDTFKGEAPDPDLPGFLSAPRDD